MTRWLGGGFVALGSLAFLGSLVAAGVCTGVDQFAVHHLMPGLYPYVGGERWAVRAGGLAPLTSPGNPGRIVNRIADVAYIPAGGVVASALFALAALAGVVRGRRIAIVAVWGAAYAVGNLLEVAGKVLLTRPPLHTPAVYGSVQIGKFDTSFPSGHTIRAVLLAAFIVWLAPASRWPVAGWATVVVVMLVAAGTHTPSDVVGGLLVAAAAIMFCLDAESRLTRLGRVAH